MKDLLVKIKELKESQYLQIESKEWISTTCLKCMDQDFLLEKIKDRRKMPWSIGVALVYLLRSGYIRLTPTHAGCEFAREMLEKYNQAREKKHKVVVERRRMRYIVQKGKFELDKITSCKDSSTIYGYYEDVQVKAFTYGHYITLSTRGTTTYVGSGKLYDKIRDDITNALRSPKGRLKVIGAGVRHIKRYLQG